MCTIQNVTLRDGTLQPIELNKINTAIEKACENLPGANWSDVALRSEIDWYDGISTSEIDLSTIKAAQSLIEHHPDYAYAAARLKLAVCYQDVFGAKQARLSTPETLYRSNFLDYFKKAVNEELLDPKVLTEFNLDSLAGAIEASRDLKFKIQGLQTLEDRYFIRSRNKDRDLLELPQWFFMRVACGIALGDEGDKTEMAIEFYNTMSTHCYLPSTPTLFNSATMRPQMSSCYLSTIPDSIEGIFGAGFSENAFLSKWAGGIGNDWTAVRASGSRIRGTNGDSQGLIPWLKIDNDIAVAVNQGGKRKGSHCAYLETWHLDIEDFLQLRKNTGDERRRTPDMNTANWIPDLFMERVESDSEWTLFSPNEVPELHGLFGQAFHEAYIKREADFDEGKIMGRRINATTLWRKMLSMIFETGHPWITFKDPCNIRSPQNHVGIVNSSNLCTEITLNSSETETAVCNIGSVNLMAHITDGAVDFEKLNKTIKTATRMLDNVISVGFYPIEKAERASKTHRAVGLGIMGWQHALYTLGIDFESEEHIKFADELMEAFSYAAISASSDLAVERSAYDSFAGSKLDRGIFPFDTVDLLQKERGLEINVNRNTLCDWDALKDKVRSTGMRNSNVIAIAPTATIANIIGVSQSIEPLFRNLYVKSNLSGEFIDINEFLVRDLKKAGLWCEKLCDAIKRVDGDISRLPDLPEDIIKKYPQAFSIDMKWVIQAAAERGKWIDQSQSINLYIAKPSGKALEAIYFLAWHSGLKTTYYLRSLSASQVEKSTLDTSEHGATHLRSVETAGAVCNMEEGCESCQ